MKGLAHSKKLLIICIFAFINIFIVSCGGGGDIDEDEIIPEKVNISGLVKGSGGLVDVSVSAGGISTKSDNNGAFILEDVPVTENKRILVTYRKTGYSTSQQIIFVENEQSFTTVASLLSYDLTERIDNGTQAQTVTVVENAKTLVSLQLDDGSVSRDNVTINIATGDPTTIEGLEVVPGDFTTANTVANEPDMQLEAIAYAEVTIVDEQGNILSELAAPATLKIRLPDIYQVGGASAGSFVAGDTEKGKIPWWSYDEDDGTWVREDADPSTSEVDDAIVIKETGILFVQAKLSHLTWYMVGALADQACMCVNVADVFDNPVIDAMVVAKGVTYSGLSYSYTSSVGRACLGVQQSSATVPPPEEIELYVGWHGAFTHTDLDDLVKYYYEPSVDERGSDLNNIITPTLARGIDRPGNCVYLDNNIVVTLRPVVSISRSSDGDIPNSSSVTLIATASDPDGGTIVSYDWSINSGEGELDPETGDTVVWTAPDLDSGVTSVRLRVADDENESSTANIIIHWGGAGAPDVSITRNPTSGQIVNGDHVDLEAVATDPGGSIVSYVWRIVDGGGSLSATTGNLVTWTAPTIGNGTANIQVAVTDNEGYFTTRSISVDWGPVGVPDVSITRDPATGQILNSGQVDLEAFASDPDGGSIVSYSWSIVNGGGVLNTTTGNLVTWTAPATGHGISNIQVTVTDSDGESTTQGIALAWGTTGEPIINSLTRIPGSHIDNDVVVTLTASATDPDGGSIVSYGWSIVSGEGVLSATTGSSITWTAPAAGTGSTEIRVTVTDDEGQTATQNVTINWGTAVPVVFSISGTDTPNTGTDFTVTTGTYSIGSTSSNIYFTEGVSPDRTIDIAVDSSGGVTPLSVNFTVNASYGNYAMYFANCAPAGSADCSSISINETNKTVTFNNFELPPLAGAATDNITFNGTIEWIDTEVLP